MTHEVQATGCIIGELKNNLLSVHVATGPS